MRRNRSEAKFGSITISGSQVAISSLSFGMAAAGDLAVNTTATTPAGGAACSMLVVLDTGIDTGLNTAFWIGFQIQYVIWRTVSFYSRTNVLKPFFMTALCNMLLIKCFFLRNTYEDLISCQIKDQ